MIAAAVFAGVCLAPAPARAQISAGPAAPDASLAPAATAVDVDPQTYHIAVTDVLSIDTVNFPTLTIPKVTVLSDGTIMLPLLGAVHVAGMTPQQAQDMLANKWNEYVVNPAVSITVDTEHIQEVLVSGFVDKAGSTDYLPGMRILDAIASVGGARIDGDLSTTTVTHPNGTVEVFDLSDPETKGNSPANILLQAGDNVYIPQRHTEIGVVGAVQKPGSYVYADKMTVLDAVTQAGGVIDDADLSHATLTHDGSTTPLDLYAMLNKGDMSQNGYLSPGDQIVIPVGDRVYVFGFVTHPGYYDLKPGDHLLDALNAVGGPADEADLGNVAYVTTDPVTHKTTLQRADVDRFLKNGDPAGNILLSPGLVIYVPHKHQNVNLTDFFNGLTGLYYLGRLVPGV